MDDKLTIKEIRNAIVDGNTGLAISMLTSNEGLRDVMTTFGTWLHVAARHGKLDLVRFLLEFGIAVNVRGGIAGSAPIHLAASQGHLDVVKYLHSSGAELDVGEPERNPLFGAIYGGHLAVAKFLIESGINTEVKYTGENMKDMDALAFAREWGRNDIANVLLENVEK